MEHTNHRLTLRRGSASERAPRRAALSAPGRIQLAGVSVLWRITVWLRSLLPARPAERDVRRVEFRTQTRGMGLRLTEFARDRLRGRWLRLRQNDE